MAAVSASWVLHLLPLLLLLVATSDAATINITNRCSYTVWPGALPGGNHAARSREVVDIERVCWCHKWRASHLATHQLLVRCQRQWVMPNGRLRWCARLQGLWAAVQYMAEFSIGQGSMDFFDISLVDGFNVHIEFLPVPTHRGPVCTKEPCCVANITLQCPDNLQAPGGYNNACTVFKQDKYCYTGNVASGCKPTTYSLLFMRMCPDVYT